LRNHRVLKLLAGSEHGINAGLLVLGHGFERRVLAGLVKAGLAAAEREVVMASGKPMEIFRIRITATGRDALGASQRARRPAAFARRYRRMAKRPENCVRLLD
jgi:hypothetical protein